MVTMQAMIIDLVAACVSTPCAVATICCTQGSTFVASSMWLQIPRCRRRFLLPRSDGYTLSLSRGGRCCHCNVATTWICRRMPFVAITAWLHADPEIGSRLSPLSPLDTLADLVYNRVKKEGRKLNVKQTKPISTYNPTPQTPTISGADGIHSRPDRVLYCFDILSCGPPSSARGVASMTRSLFGGRQFPNLPAWGALAKADVSQRENERR